MLCLCTISHSLPVLSLLPVYWLALSCSFVLVLVLILILTLCSQGAASSIYGLAKMRFVYSELPPPVTRCIEELVLSVGSTSAPNHDNSPGTGRGRNKNQATFVPSSEPRPDTDTADGQTVSSLLWSLGRMHGQWAGVTADTGSSAIHKSTVKTKEEEQEQEDEEEESSLIEEAGSGREAGQAHEQGPVLQKVMSAELCAKVGGGLMLIKRHDSIQW